MNEDKIQRRVKLSTAVYGELIRAYPKGFREKYGPEMAQVFSEQCRDAATSAGGFGLTRLWLCVLFDLLKSVSREHIAVLGWNAGAFKQALLSRLWLAPILALLVVGGVSAGVSAFLLPKSYQSNVRLLVTREPPPDCSWGSPDSPDNWLVKERYWLQTQFEVIQSPLVLNQVIENLSLNQRLADRFGANRPWQTEMSYHWLRSHINLQQTRNTTLIEVVVLDVSANQAAEIANEITKVVVKRMSKETEADRAYFNKWMLGADGIYHFHYRTLQPGEALIVDMAEPGLRPVRPNIPAATVGFGLSAAILSFLVVVVARRFRTHQVPA